VAEYSDVSFNLKPEFLKVVKFIYDEQAGLKKGERVLIVSDCRTPDHVVSAFVGVAMQVGAEVYNIRVPMGPHPAYQPGHKWGDLLVAAAEQADLLVDMAIGYAEFLVRLTKTGKLRVIMPGDATGAPHIEDSLIRCLLMEDVYERKREAARICEIMTAGSTMRVTSEEGTDYTVSIKNLEASPFDGFMLDHETGQIVSQYEITPGALPGFVLPVGSGDGVLAIDGLLLYENVHTLPRDPLLLTIEKGRLVEIGGDRLLATRLDAWLKSLGEEACYNGPIHANLGLSKMARLTEHLEFERVRGATVFGFGDNAILAPYYGGDFPMSSSSVHWDAQILRTTLDIDDRRISENGIIGNF
jgi:leucyl aminopeptidase (aminopeptidase T)